MFKGEFVCLLGPNGAGKSTLLKTLTGYIPPINGNTFINNKNISEYSKRELSKTFSIVFTEKIRIPNMTILEMVSLGRSPYTGFLGQLKDNDHHIVSESLKLVGIFNLKNNFLHNLSDGELQKVMIAKAMAQNTPVIILDEPTAFLDLPSRIEIMRLLRNLAKEKNKGILLSTHDLDLALQMADRIWLLDKNKQLTAGTPEDLVLNNQFRHFFEKEGVLFDNESGAFKMHQNNIKSIRLIGKGIEYKWVKRALNRNGYNTTPEKGNYLNIEITSNGHREYLLSHPSGSELRFQSIEDLLKEIKNIENKKTTSHHN
ncbi:MAG: ABC transporter ATP-binding protein [Marinilabiliaceae bacterium]|nr:ABC transporter ATP-binding protein [Marinilabiliaceae bacterium]